MSYIKTKWTNPNGNSVFIWVHEGFNINRIGEDAYIGEDARIGEDAHVGRCGYIGVGDYCDKPAYIAPLPFGPSNYYITITDKNMTICCETHPIENWQIFDKERIFEMDGKKAVEYWRKAKPIIFQFIKSIRGEK